MNSVALSVNCVCSVSLGIRDTFTGILDGFSILICLVRDWLSSRLPKSISVGLTLISGLKPSHCSL